MSEKRSSEMRTEIEFIKELIDKFDMDENLICRTCGKRFGNHEGLQCPIEKIRGD